MKLIYSGIHKRLGFLIQHIGGYDRNYHITKVSKQLGIARKYIVELFNNADSKKLSNYIKLLNQGISLDDVLQYARIDKEKRIIELNAMYGILNTCINRSPMLSRQNIIKL